jgi:hypothetical protein
MRKLARIPATVGMMIGLAATLGAQELQDGKWTLRVTQPNGNIVNITLEVKRGPDPHTRWRLGSGQLVAYTATRGENVFPLTDVRLEGDKLTWSAQGPITQCSLTRQKDGGYAGECLGPDKRPRPITMLPAPPPAPTPAQK